MKPSPVQTTTQQEELTAVVCTSAGHCVASGNGGAAGNKGFISTIEGGVLGSADYGTGVSALQLGSLTCRATNCWATGGVIDKAAYGGIEGAIYPIVSGAPTTAIGATRTYSLPAISMMGSGVIAAANTLNRNRCAVAVLG
jgi:hypothetical protein